MVSKINKMKFSQNKIICLLLTLTYSMRLLVAFTSNVTNLGFGHENIFYLGNRHDTD